MSSQPHRSLSAIATTTIAIAIAGVSTLAGAAQAAGPAPVYHSAERLHAGAVEAFRQARFSEAYGRFIGLADAGHAPSAQLALWMYLNGPALFGKDWDSTQEQLTAWAQLAGQPAPTLVGRVYVREQPLKRTAAR